ncbi:MAG: tannase/feruloyl esterase family alpha/beta hydrolase, partial [Acidobacteria bacterium]|nr:tannase/feruloyl esterase family alpha/beta hydrolase [Acidobacteriota bacterium]
LQAQIDYAFRATHVAALAGKAITEHYYGKAPRKSYFWGCSGGGRQGLVEAQRFPWDFDGIVVVAPGINLSGVLMSRLWNTRVATQGGPSLFSPADVKWLHEAVVAKCDQDDGVKDGVIGNPLACKIDPSEWACKAGNKAPCLSAAQAEAFTKIYAGPTNSKGDQIHTGGFVPGLEFSIPTTPEVWTLSRDFCQYMGFTPAPGPSWKPTDFDFDRDYKRLALAQALLEDANPDLRKFKAAGGKLILAHGWTDGLSPLNTIDYYEMAEKTMGGREATQDFFRLFMVPGMGHCSGGAGAYAIDYLSSLENWTEKGQAPDVMIGAHVKEEVYTGWNFKLPAEPADVTFTRPVYPYPLRAKYKGTGDPNDAGSFKPVGP